MTHDPVKSPDHYTRYPVQPIAITRHLGFCLGNAVKYVMRAPYKGGVQDCDKALQYLEWEAETPQAVSRSAWYQILPPLNGLAAHIAAADSEPIHIREIQLRFIDTLVEYTLDVSINEMQRMTSHVRDLREALEKEEA